MLKPPLSSASSLVALFVLMGSLPACKPKPEPADLVLTGGKIVTLVESQPVVAALAARGDRIVALGTAEEISRLVGPKTRVLDLGGALAVPGLEEGHGHFLGVGQARMQLQ
ncbi:MAG: amidohydrolase, partial [Acidobacteria bacterium]|nr:amidohydrolase [Acidobacteriota bacterium]